MHARIQLTGPVETRTMYTQLEDIKAHTLLSRSQVCKVWIEPVYAQPATSALSTLFSSLIGREPSQASALIRVMSRCLVQPSHRSLFTILTILINMT